MKDRHIKQSVIWGSLIGGGFVIGLLFWVGPRDFLDQMKNVSLFHLFIYIFFSIIVYLLRALRFRMLVGGRGSLAELYSIVSIHTFLLNVLPFSGGDLSFPVLLKKFNISKSYLAGVPSLVIARLQDLTLTVLFLGLSLIWLGALGNFFTAKNLAIGTVVTCSIIGPLFFMGRKKWLTIDWSKIQEKYRHIPLFNKVTAILKDAILSARSINRNIIFQTSVLAFFAKIIGVLGAYYLINGIGLSMELPIAFLFCSVYVFLPFLPINTVAGLGVTEAFIGGFFLLVGVQKEIIIPASIQIHALQLSVAVLLGGLGFAQMYVLRIQTPKNATRKGSYHH